MSTSKSARRRDFHRFKSGEMSYVFELKSPERKLDWRVAKRSLVDWNSSIVAA